MKLCLRNQNKVFTKEQQKVIYEFFKFLQSQLKLEDPLEIEFVEKRNGGMTTGVRKPHSRILVLVKNRLLIDIMRTIAHEWVHEFQHQSLGLDKFKKKPQDIGGPVENMANVLSGIFIKKFEKSHPQFNERLYGE